MHPKESLKFLKESYKKIYDILFLHGRIKIFLITWLTLNLFIFLLPISKEQSIFKNSDKVYHIFFSSITAFLFYLSFKKWKFSVSGSFLFTLSYGFLIEIIQGILPYREFSYFDLLSDALGGALFLGLIFVRNIEI